MLADFCQIDYPPLGGTGDRGGSINCGGWARSLDEVYRFNILKFQLEVVSTAACMKPAVPRAPGASADGPSKPLMVSARRHRRTPPTTDWLSLRCLPGGTTRCRLQPLHRPPIMGRQTARTRPPAW